MINKNLYCFSSVCETKKNKLRYNFILALASLLSEIIHLVHTRNFRKTNLS